MTTRVGAVQRREAGEPGKEAELHYQRIPRWSKVSREMWDDWRWQAANILTDEEGLAEVLELTEDERQGFRLTSGSFRMAIPPYYAALMDPDHPWCPVRRMAVPHVHEALVQPGELRDPLAEDSHMPVPGLVHRYPDRALLLLNNVCVMYCRFCTRKRLTGQDNETLSWARIEAAIGYLKAHPEVRDVILSGGDPLMLSDRRIEAVLGALRSVSSVEIIRIGTRLPVVMPQRVTRELALILRAHQPVWLITHFNHPKELSAEAVAACARLVDAGVPVENQSVLLRRVNSSLRIQRELVHRLLAARVRPYYLHQCDLAEGLEDFRTPVAKGVEIIEGLRGHTSGLAVPSFVIDCPGGGGKVALGPDYAISWAEDHVLLRNFEGKQYRYPEPRERDCSCPYEEVWYEDGGRQSAV